MPAKCTLGACTDIDVVVSLLQLLMLLLGESRSKSIYLKLIRKSFVMNTTQHSGPYSHGYREAPTVAY